MSLVFGSMEPSVGLGADEARFQSGRLVDGYGDETGALWWPDGRLAVTVQQLVWVRDAA